MTTKKQRKTKKSVEKIFSIFFGISFSIFSWKGLNGKLIDFVWQNGNAITRKWLWTDGVDEKREKKLGKGEEKKEKKLLKNTNNTVFSLFVAKILR